LECQPDFPRVQERIARLHLKESRLDDAFKHIKIATTANARRLSAWLLKAQIAEAMMDNAEQEAALGQIIKIDRDHAQARFELGVLLFNRQRSKGAQKQLKHLQTLGSSLADELSDLMESGGVR
jgi:tetratricopeptide (TPR) repeat protein